MWKGTHLFCWFSEGCSELGVGDFTFSILKRGVFFSKFNDFGFSAVPSVVEPPSPGPPLSGDEGSNGEPGNDSDDNSLNTPFSSIPWDEHCESPSFTTPFPRGLLWLFESIFGGSVWCSLEVRGSLISCCCCCVVSGGPLLSVGGDLRDSGPVGATTAASDIVSEQYSREKDKISSNSSLASTMLWRWKTIRSMNNILKKERYPSILPLQSLKVRKCFEEEDNRGKMIPPNDYKSCKKIRMTLLSSV